MPVGPAPQRIRVADPSYRRFRCAKILEVDQEVLVITFLRAALAAACAVASAAVMPMSAHATAPACAVGPAAFRNPFGTHLPNAWTALQHSQRGVWTGSAYDGIGDFKVLAWRRGHRVQVLDERSYRNITYGIGSVRTVGVTAAGAVVANLQARTAGRMWTFAYLHGRRFQLAAPKSWRDMAALAVTRSGEIVGYGIVKPWHYILVTWHDIHAQPQVLGIVGTRMLSSPLADQHGDIAWSTQNRNAVTRFHVRLASGAIRTLTTDFPDSGGNLGAAAGSQIYASVDRHVVRWDLANAPSSGPIPARTLAAIPGATGVDTAGPNGAVIWGADHRTLQVGNRAPVAIPHEYYSDGPVGEAISPYNVVAYTSANDRLVHLMTCG